MRCLACNKLLSDYEATRKYENGDFIDLCNHCFATIADSVITIDRQDLSNVEEEEIENE